MQHFGRNRSEADIAVRKRAGALLDSGLRRAFSGLSKTPDAPINCGEL